MANLKDIDPDKLFAQLAEVELQGHERLRQTTHEMIEELKTATHARASLPDRASDLIAQAKIAHVLDVDWTRSVTGWSSREGTTMVHQASVRANGGEYTIASGNSIEIPAGKYRLLFFVLPIKE